MAQYESITGRRPRFRYDLGIREATPAARNRYYSGQQLGIERDRLKEQKRQFEEAQAYQEKQDTISNVVGGAGTAASIYSTFGGSGSAGGTAAAGAGASSGSGAAAGGTAAGSSAGAGGSEAGAGGSSLGTAGAIAAIIAGQYLLGEATDTEFEGQPTRHFFSTNEEGNWSPGIANDPWLGWSYQQMGAGASPGQKMDARLWNEDWGGAAKSLPATVDQWTDPVRSLGYGAASSLLTNQAGMSDQEADAAMMLVDPMSAAVHYVEDTYLCTEIKRVIGMSHLENAAMMIIRAGCLKKFKNLTHHYFRYGGELVKAINNKVEFPKQFWAQLKDDMVKPVIGLIAKGDIDGAINKYALKALDLFDEYAPDLYPGR